MNKSFHKMVLLVMSVVLLVVIVPTAAKATDSASILIDKDAVNVAPNYLATLTASVSSSDSEITWSSSDVSIATVAVASSTSCNVTGVRSTWRPSLRD